MLPFNNMHVAEHGSEAFEDFLGCLGEKIRLKGWEKFNGGLDTERTNVVCSGVKRCNDFSPSMQ